MGQPDLIDTHCHLDHPPLGKQVEAVLTRAQAVGVTQCVTIGTSLDTSRMALSLAQRHPMVRAAIGIHPHNVMTATTAVVDALERLAADPLVVAIGEVGLDFYRQQTSTELQERVFLQCVALAKRRKLPLIIHCRDAYERLLQLLRDPAHGETFHGVMHCASGPPAFIRSALDMGFCISFAGNVTFPKAYALRELVPLVPDDRLLIETDAPFLTPQPVRGQPNEPAYVAHTAQLLAQLRGMSIEALATMTSRNARRLFGLI